MARITSLSGEGGEAPVAAQRPFGGTAVTEIDDDGVVIGASDPDEEQDSDSPESQAQDSQDETESEQLADEVEEPEEPAEAEASQTEEPDEDEADDDDAGPSAGEQPPEPEVGEPVRYQVGRQIYDAPGAAMYSSGWMGIKPEGVPEALRLMQLGRYQETVGRVETQRLKDELRVARNTVNENAVKGKAAWDLIYKLATDPPGPDGKDAQARMYEFVTNLHDEFPKLVAQAERQVSEAHYKAAQALRQEDPQVVAQREQQELEGRAELTIYDLAQRIGRDDRFKALSDNDIEQLADRLWRSRGLTFTRAPETTTTAQGVVQKGDWIINDDYLWQELNAAVDLANARAAQAQRDKTVQTHNARRLQRQPGRPSAAGGQREIAEPATGPKPRFKNKEQYERYMMRMATTGGS